MGEQKKYNNRSQSLIQLGLFLAVLLLLNIAANRFYTHLDLTEDKRFSLTPATKRVVKNLDDILFVNVFLAGDFSSDVKRMQSAVKDMLDKFKSLSGNVEYQFINPLEGDPKDVNETLEGLKERGIFEYVDKQAGNDEFSAKRVFPGATLYYKGREISIYFLEHASPGMPKQIRFNNSISLLEYSIANAIQKLQTIQKGKIAILTGHGELREFETADFEASLQPYYDLARINLDSVIHINPKIKVLVVPKPLGPFSPKDKFKIDQYVMNGGKILWLIDRMNADIDSLRTSPVVIPSDLPLELEDLFFKYGVRINPNLVQDLQATKIPIQIGMEGGKPQFDLKPWYYHPVVLPSFDSDHPIVKSLDGIDFKFASSIDTLQTKTFVKKTFLLSSSEFSRVQFSPVRLTFEILRYPPQREKFDKGFQPLAVLLEGEFPSLYENRVTEGMQAGLEELNLQFRSSSVPTKMIFVSDGDVIRNPVDLEKRELKPLGFNVYERYTFANKDFLLNCIEYLMDTDGLIGARSKEVKLRLLNKAKMASDASFFGIPVKEKTRNQLMNVILPLVLLLGFGVLYNYLRRRKYSAKAA